MTEYRTIADVEVASLQAIRGRALEAHKAFYGADLEVQRLEDLKEHAEVESLRDEATVLLEQAVAQRDQVKAVAVGRCQRARITPTEKRTAEQEVVNRVLAEAERRHVEQVAVLSDLDAADGEEPEEQKDAEREGLLLRVEVAGRAVELYQKLADGFVNRATRRATAKTRRNKPAPRRNEVRP